MFLNKLFVCFFVCLNSIITKYNYSLLPLVVNTVCVIDYDYYKNIGSFSMRRLDRLLIEGS